MDLEETSPRISPPVAWLMIIGFPALIAVPAVGTVLVDGVRLNWAQAAIGATGSGLLAIAGLYWFYYGFSRSRAAADTATSRIASAAQGYVELSGEAFQLPGTNPPFCTPDGVACLWYRGDGLTPESGADGTQNPFGIRDDTGYAVVLPYGAVIVALESHVWTDAGTTHAEDRIYAGDRLFVVGEFTTSEPRFELETTVADKLFRWRANPRALLKQFDANRDGQIDSAEDWKMRMRAVQDAKAEEQAALAEHHAVNLIKCPADGRSFVISSRSQRGLNRRFLAWELAGVLAFVIGITGAASIGYQLVSRGVS